MTGERRIKLGFEFHLLARLKHACANDAFGVHENVGTAVVGLNKSEAAILIVHLNNSRRHSFSSGWVKWAPPHGTNGAHCLCSLLGRSPRAASIQADYTPLASQTRNASLT